MLSRMSSIHRELKGIEFIEALRTADRVGTLDYRVVGGLYGNNFIFDAIPVTVLKRSPRINNDYTKI